MWVFPKLISSLPANTTIQYPQAGATEGAALDSHFEMHANSSHIHSSTTWTGSKVQQVQAGRQIFGKCQRTLWTEWLSGSVARWFGGQVACWPSNLLLALLLLQLQSKVRLSDWNWDWDWDRAWIYRCKTWNRVGYRRRQLLESFAGRAGHGARVAARGMWQLQHIQPVAIYTSGLAGDIWLL